MSLANIREKSFSPTKRMYRIARTIPRPHFQQTRNVNVFSEFVNSVKRQVKENEQLQKDVKLLSQESQKVTESEAMKNAKKAISKTSEATSKVIGAVGSAVDATLETPLVKATGQVISKTTKVVADVTQKVAEPIMETEAAKTVSKGIHSIKNDVVGITGNAYFAEYNTKEVREQKKKELMAKRAPKQVRLGPDGLPLIEGPVKADEESTGIVMHKSSRLAEAWSKFKSESAIGQTWYSYKRNLEEKDSPLLQFWRNIRESTKSEESEGAKVVRLIRTVDPTFEQNAFLDEVAHFIIPELLEAYLLGNEKVLKEWVTEGQFARLKTDFAAQVKAGLLSDCKVVDYRNVEIQKVVLLEEEFPVIVISFRTTEILCFKNKKGEVVLGAEDNLQNAAYGLAFTKAQLMDPDAEHNPNTNGWTIIQWARQTL